MDELETEALKLMNCAINTIASFDAAVKGIERDSLDRMS